MARLDDPLTTWRYGVRVRGRWVAQNGTWERDGSHPAVYWWPTIEQARDWRDRHMPDSGDAWAEAIGLFRDGCDITAAWNRGEFTDATS